MEDNQFLLHSFRKFLKDTDKTWNYITPTDFYHKYYHKNPFILDIREKEDFNEFHIKGATNIFWLDLLKDENLKKIPKNKKRSKSDFGDTVVDSITEIDKKKVQFLHFV